MFLINLPPLWLYLIGPRVIKSVLFILPHLPLCGQHLYLFYPIYICVVNTQWTCPPTVHISYRDRPFLYNYLVLPWAPTKIWIFFFKFITRTFCTALHRLTHPEQKKNLSKLQEQNNKQKKYVYMTTSKLE